MKRLSISWDTALIASIVTLAGVCAQAQHVVVAEEAELEGPIVRIAPDENGEGVIDLSDEPKTRIIEQESYWIGIRGRSIESEVLRTHLQLAQNMGVVVEEVLPESPADKAGLQKHDIILRANDDTVNDMSVMQQHVREGGEKPIELKIIRYGQHEKVVVVPEKRPEKFSSIGGDRNGFDRFHPGQDFDQMMGILGQLQGRQIGPGMVFRGQGFGMGRLPNGVTVQVQKQNDGPAQITVKQGDKTWEIVGDDAEALKQLPDDVRPFVENMLGKQGGGFGKFRMQGFNMDMDDLMLKELPRAMRGIDKETDRAEKEISQRIQELEKQLKDLQKRIEE